MITIVVCDDTPRDREAIRDAIALTAPEAQVRLFSAPGELLKAAEEGFRPDLAVLDIQLEGMDGIALANRLGALHPGCRIIFISEYLGYATEVYAVRHSYFLLKSQLRERMGAAIRRAVEDLGSLPRLSFQMRGQLQTVDVSGVLYLERVLRKTYVHCAERCYETTEHPREILRRANSVLFCQCHQSFWVNLARVDAMTGETFTLMGGQQVPISRSFHKSVQTRFFAHLHRELESAPQ